MEALVKLDLREKAQCRSNQSEKLLQNIMNFKFSNQ